MTSYLESLETQLLSTESPSEVTSVTSYLDSITVATESDGGAGQTSYLDSLDIPNLQSSETDLIPDTITSDTASDPSVTIEDAPIPSSSPVVTEVRSEANNKESPQTEASDGSDSPIPSSPVVKQVQSATKDKESSQTEASDGSKVLAIVPISKNSIEFTSGLVGGAIGLLIGGPLFAVFTAAAANYVSRGSGGEANEVVKNIAKSGLDVYNYIARFDGKYEILENVKKNLDTTYENVKNNENVDKEDLEKLEENIKEIYEQLDYDIIDTGGVALGVVGDLIEKGLDGVGKINSEYKLTEQAISSINKAVEATKSPK